MAEPLVVDDQLREELYHYTSVNGLQGILETNVSQATHVAYLNDSQEFVCGAAEGISARKSYPYR
jgi:hypothetical protein